MEKLRGSFNGKMRQYFRTHDIYSPPIESMREILRGVVRRES
jgi:hypothetical protein